ncbi:MAG TPA: hypothetical protein VK878_12885 [Candidatus Deferrimicrobiaceae bacterium]|nr:hypothetical protein [Candidatus Deferrimicrobiaceae bacterium]
MTAPTLAPDGEAAACLAGLDAALAGSGLPALARVSAAALDLALRALVKRHGAAALPLLERLADAAPDKEHRRAARRALYRLEQSGLRPAGRAAAAPARPVVTREAEHPVRAWLSGIDGSGSRAAWILFEGGLGGGLRLCSLILNDEAGIMDAAGGPIARKRLEAELRGLRESQKLPWVEVDGHRACALVADALALHERLGTVPPPEFARWRKIFTALSNAGAQKWPPHSTNSGQPSGGHPSAAGGQPSGGPSSAAGGQPSGGHPFAGGGRPGLVAPDAALVDRSAELLDLPELMGWFVDPGRVQHEALALLQVRESRLVVSDRIKAEREASIVDGVVEAQLPDAARRRWAGRLREMAEIFRMTGRGEAATLAEQTAAALADPGRAATSIPFARALAARGVEMASEVALGRTRLADVTRAPARRARS